MSIRPLNDSGSLGRPIGLMALFLLLIYLIQPKFFSVQNLSSVLYYTALVTPALIGVHLLMVVGLFDLSIGAIAAVAGVVVAQGIEAGIPLSVSIVLAVLAGCLFGCANWCFVSILRIPALIGTLITMCMARAAALGVSQGRTVGGLPDQFGEFAQGRIGFLSYAVVFAVVVIVVVEILAQRHLVFRRMYHVGSNRSAAASCGVRVSSIELVAFILSAAGAATVGLLQASRTLSASPLLFGELALECIAGAVIGGTSLSGGRGRATGAFFGMFMVVVSRNLTILLDVNIYWRDLAVGLILLAAMLASRVEKAGE